MGETYALCSSKLCLGKKNGHMCNIESATDMDFLQEFVKILKDPTHSRIVGAYTGANPLRSMEEELGKVLTELVQDED